MHIDFRIGSKAALTAPKSNFRFHPESGLTSDIDPSPKSANDRDLAARGRTIYLEGIPESNIVSCYACHGPNAEGVRDIPRLGGLAYFYLKGRLEQWGEGYHSGIESPMPLVASHGPERN